MPVVLATHNRHKVGEFRAILGERVVWLTLDDFPDVSEPEEDGLTLEDNASLKALHWASRTGWIAVADDSGLEVDVLGGAPGVYSARYAGLPVDAAANCRKLLEALDGLRDRRARFRCVLALATPGSAVVAHVSGACEGHIATEARGVAGFGYDPVFIPEGETRTFAEMSPSEKHARSHRARALAAAEAAWGDRLRAGGGAGSVGSQVGGPSSGA